MLVAAIICSLFAFFGGRLNGRLESSVPFLYWLVTV